MLLEMKLSNKILTYSNAPSKPALLAAEGRVDHVCWIPRGWHFQNLGVSFGFVPVSFCSVGAALPTWCSNAARL